MTDPTPTPQQPGRRAFLGRVAVGLPIGVAAASGITKCDTTPSPTTTGLTGFQVRDFGAKGDGVTDDTAAFGQAFSAVAAFGGGIVYVPPGTYRVGRIYPPAGCTLLGAGVASSIKLLDDNPATMLNLTAPDITISHLQLDGNTAGQSNQGTVYDTVAMFPSAARIRIRDCWIHDANGYQVVAFPGCSDIEVSRCIVTGGTEEGIECHGSVDFRILGNLVQDAGKNAIYVWQSTESGGIAHASPVFANVVSNWSRFSNGWGGIVIDDGALDVAVSGNALAGAPGTGTGVAVSTDHAVVYRTAVTGNAIDGVRGYGIHVRNSPQTTVSANAVSSSAAAGIHVWINSPATDVSANVVDQSGTNGILLVDATDFTARANVVQGSGRTGSGEGPTTALLVSSVSTTAGNGVVAANRALDGTAPMRSAHGTGTSGTVTNVQFHLNVTDGSSGTGHGCLGATYPGGASLLPMRAVRGVAVGDSQVAVPHGLGRVPGSVSLTMSTAGQVWQSTPADATNLYLTADGQSRRCDLLVG